MRVNTKYITSTTGAGSLTTASCLGRILSSVHVPSVQLRSDVFFSVHNHLGLTGTSEILPVEFIYLAFTHMPSKDYCRRLGAFMCLCDVFRALINSLVS